jgi:hypothetical protein
MAVKTYPELAAEATEQAWNAFAQVLPTATQVVESTFDLAGNALDVQRRYAVGVAQMLETAAATAQGSKR